MVTKKNKFKNCSLLADVPQAKAETFNDNICAITRGTGRLFMFAADQKVEHLNDDFYGRDIDRQANDPEHIFKIARDGAMGALAVHAGLLARYGLLYNSINYIVKLNGKTNLHAEGSDPVSALMWDIDDVLAMSEEHKLNIRGIGFTLYLGSEHEALMMSQAAQMVSQAHQQGLVAILWIYPRAQHLKDVSAPRLIAGAAGLGNALGADFVKVHTAHSQENLSGVEALAIATEAAGNTGVIVSGGEYVAAEDLLKRIYEQITQGGTAGCAIGRNLLQRSYEEALAISQAIAALVYDNVSYQKAKSILLK
jgi:DhnA family fructose-bisphosphate aldolase class Ia